MSPAELILGAKLALPTQLLTTESPSHLLKPPQTHNSRQAQQFAIDLGSSLKHSFDVYSQTLLESRANMKTQYDKNTKKHHYKVHDTVMLWNPRAKQGVSRCWQPKWCGPWKVLKLIGDTNCQLIKDDSKFSPVVHVNQLKYIPQRFTHFHTLPTHGQPPCQNLFRKTCNIFNELDNATSNAKQSQGIIQEDGNDRSEIMTEQENVDEPQEHLEPGKSNGANEVNENKHLTESWCRLNVSNILPGRTRSQSLI